MSLVMCVHWSMCYRLIIAHGKLDIKCITVPNKMCFVQIENCQKKLEAYKEEKHLLFQELKKVLHDEDERKKHKELEQKQQYVFLKLARILLHIYIEQGNEFINKYSINVWLHKFWSGYKFLVSI